MFGNLRTRLIVSHALPILMLTPALALVLVFLLETPKSLGTLADQMIGQGTLIVEIAREDPAVWHDAAKAETLVEQVKPNIPSRVMLLDGSGRLLASSLPADDARLGRSITFPVIQEALAGQTNWFIDYSPYMGTRILDMAIPVFDDSTHALIGIVRLSYDISAIEQRTVPLSRTIIVTFAIGTLLALLLGVQLARSLNAPLLNLTQAIARFAPGTPPPDIPETGPEEVRLVARNYNRMMHRLRELELTRQQLIANVVHELGTPLGAIKAATEALRNGAAADPALANELTHGINSQIDQLRLLVDDLALLGESELKEITLNREWCSLQTVIQTQCSAYTYWAKQKRIDLRAQIAPGIPPVYVDPRRLGQILANLLYNAYKYSPPGAQIVVTAGCATEAEPPTAVWVEVADNGPGIAPEEQARIFDLLYRSPHQRNLHKGMGIGLALSRRLAEAHGGTISVSSVPGAGATFRVMLPIR